MNNYQMQQQPKYDPYDYKTLNNQLGKKIVVMEKEGLGLPANYNYQNALKKAFLILGEVKNIQNATQASVASALLDMVTQGLTPAKNQCYFIVYGNEVKMQRSYFGTVAALLRLKGIDDVSAEVIHKDDKFKIGSDEDMKTVVKVFEPEFENLDKPIVGAFAVIKHTDGKRSYTVMTMTEIEKSWNQSRNRGNAVQKNFSQEMAKRTVLNRAAKMIINTSDDSDLLTGSINDTTENEYEDRQEIRATEQEVKPQSSKDLLDKILAPKEDVKQAPEPTEKEVEVITPEEEEQAENKQTENDAEIDAEYTEIDMFRQQREEENANA